MHVLQTNHRNYRKPAKTYGALAEFLGHGLLTSEGERWRTHRRMIQPGFHPQRIASLGGTMVSETNRTLSRIAAREGPQDWAAEAMELTARIIARTLFSDQLEEEELGRVRGAITRAEEIVVSEVRTPLAVLLHKVTGRKRRMLHELEDIRTLLHERISGREQDGRHYDDLVQMLREARVEGTGEGLSPDDLLDEALTFYVAGHETSSHALAWFVYETGQRAGLREELREEVERACGGRDAGAEDLAAMPLLRSVLKETLRLRSPAWIVDRETVEPDVLVGHTLPAGMLVAVCLFSLHRRADLWDGPDEFRAERFLAPGINEDHWLPFGAGPRKCIGQHFAMMELQLVAAQLLKRFDYRVRNAEEIGVKTLVTMGMDRPLLTEFEERPDR